MARIELAPEVAEDFDRILDHLATYQIEIPAQRIGEIIAALDVLEQNPLIGRPVAKGSGNWSLGVVREAISRSIVMCLKWTLSLFWRSAVSAKRDTPSV